MFKLFFVRKVKYSDWGIIDYESAWAKQTELSDALKLAKKDGLSPGELGSEVNHQLIFCHHPHVYTLGKSGSLDHLLLSERELQNRGASFFKINRGGDITYHGPGQLVGYPIFDLECFFRDVHRYVRNIEEAIIRMLSDFGIESERQKGFTGVWLPPDKSGKWRKICAIGVHLSRWVSMHGFALN
nr:lipoyl(octanoyl) transferase LipB [Saprospiraceae bacterium]